MNLLYGHPYLMFQSARGFTRTARKKRNSEMGKLNGKVAVITAATSGMALATAKRYVEEDAYVFITGRNKERLDKAVKEIGRNVTGVQADSSKLADLNRLYETVRRERA